MICKEKLLESLRDNIRTIEEGGSCKPPSCRSDNTVIVVDQEAGRNCCNSHHEGPLSDEEAFKRLERWCASRYRSESYLRKRLLAEGFKEIQVEACLDRAKRCLLIDDARYADALIRGKLRKGFGEKGINYHLRQEGIDPSSVEGWPHEYLEGGFDCEVDRAFHVLCRRPPHSKNVWNAAYGKLISKGFSTSVASSAARRFCEDRNN